MTTYDASSVSDAVIAFRKPITLQQGRGLRDNPIAIAEGADGAPRIQGSAIASEDDGLPIITVSASDYTVVSTGHGPIAGITTTYGTAYVLGQSYTIKTYNGSMRFKISHRSSNVAATSTLQLRKNGTVINTFTTTSTAFVQRIVDSTVAVNDVFEWYHTSNFSGEQSYISGHSVSASDGYVPKSAFWLASQA